VRCASEIALSRTLATSTKNQINHLSPFRVASPSTRGGRRNHRPESRTLIRTFYEHNDKAITVFTSQLFKHYWRRSQREHTLWVHTSSNDSVWSMAMRCATGNVGEVSDDCSRNSWQGCQLGTTSAHPLRESSPYFLIPGTGTFWSPRVLLKGDALLKETLNTEFQRLNILHLEFNVLFLSWTDR